MEQAGATQGHILLVEDEPGTREHLSHILEKAGFRVTTSADGEMTLGFVRTDKFDLTLLDIGLDHWGLDGRMALVTGAGQAVTALGRRFTAITCDLRQASVTDLQQVVAQVVNELGRLDILVNNAGIIRRAPAVEFSEADWDDVLQINLKAAFFLAQAAGKVMIEQGGGKIINVASMLSYQGGLSVPPTRQFTTGHFSAPS